MILSNSGYNAYDVKETKKEERKKERKGIDKNGNFKWHWLAIRVWIANGIN